MTSTETVIFNQIHEWYSRAPQEASIEAGIDWVQDNSEIACPQCGEVAVVVEDQTPAAEVNITWPCVRIRTATFKPPIDPAGIERTEATQRARGARDDRPETRLPRSGQLVGHVQ